MKLRNKNQSKKFEVSVDKLDIFDRLLSEKFHSTRMKIKKVFAAFFFVKKRGYFPRMLNKPLARVRRAFPLRMFLIIGFWV
jgi:hypothetical protein